MTLGSSELNTDFAASMIEVPTEDFGKMIPFLWEKGIRYFHVDAGDGSFITRKFSGVKKVELLKKEFPDSKVHAHLMISEPHYPHDGEICAIQQYAAAGSDAIAVHPRSFKNKQDLENSIKLIRNLNVRPGIIIETIDNWGRDLEKQIIDLDLDWVVVMGVPVGYGGQIFQFKTLQKLSLIHI